MNIAFFDVQDWENKKYQNPFRSHKIKIYSNSLTESNVSQVSDCQILSVFVYSKVDKSVLNKLPNLKYIVTRSMGFDHIDLSECKKRGIKVSTTPHYGDNSVAEHTFALILNLSRNISKAYIRNLNENHNIEGLKGFDLKGKNIGIIGLGRIGSKVAQIAHGFEMNILVFDRNKDKKLAKSLGLKYVNLENLLKNSDIVTLHVPYCSQNHHLISRKELSLMKPSALLINTSRGPVVDTEALKNALNKNKIAGAGIDVIEGEDLIRDERELIHDISKLNIQKIQQLALDHRLIKNEKVVFTPHIAFYTEEAVNKISEITIENIQSFIKNKPINLVK